MATKFISTSMRAEVVKALARPFQDRAGVIKKTLQDLATDVVCKALPVDLRQVFEKYPDCVVTDTLSVTYDPKTYRFISVTTPRVPNFKGDKHFLLQSPEFLTKLDDLKVPLADIADERVAFVKKATSCLAELRTYKRISKEFPEAFAILEKLDSLVVKPIEEDKLKGSTTELQNTLKKV